MKERKASEKKRRDELTAMKAMSKEQRRVAAWGLVNAVIPAVARITEATCTVITRSTEIMSRTTDCLEKHSTHLSDALERSFMREELLARRLTETQDRLMEAHALSMKMRESMSQMINEQIRDQARDQARDSAHNQPCSKKCNESHASKASRK